MGRNASRERRVCSEGTGLDAHFGLVDGFSRLVEKRAGSMRRLDQRRLDESAAVKPPAVAGLFYPSDPDTLSREVREYLSAAAAVCGPPKAIIAPHAGFVYSGPVAASAYVHLALASELIRTVVLLGPAHRVPLRGLAACSARQFMTPLGPVEVDRGGVEKALRLEQVHVDDLAFREEHCLEVQLPFLLATLRSFRLIPLLVGEADSRQVSEVLEALWGGPETAIVISSDLSHYHDYDTARRLDSATSQAIVSFDQHAIDYGHACGRNAVNGLLRIASERGMQARTVDLRNSGDTAGPRDRVVGYGAYVFLDRTGDGEGLSDRERQQLRDVASASLRSGHRHGKPLEIDSSRYGARLLRPRACFVTLRANGDLRGCMGSIEAARALVEDVSHNAYSAGFKDPRFSPLTDAEIPGLDISISVLSEPTEIDFVSESDLLAQVRPGVDGLILQDGPKRGTFLPAVWSTLGEPATFLRHLKQKAGLPESYWSDDIRAWRYTTESF